MKRFISQVLTFVLASTVLIAAPARANAPDPIQAGDWLQVSNDGTIWKVGNDPLAASARSYEALHTPVSSPFAAGDYSAHVVADHRTNELWVVTIRNDNSNKLWKFSFATNTYSLVGNMDVHTVESLYLSASGKLYASAYVPAAFGKAVTVINKTTGLRSSFISSSMPNHAIYESNGMILGTGYQIDLARFDFGLLTRTQLTPTRGLGSSVTNGPNSTFIQPGGNSYAFMWNGDIRKITTSESGAWSGVNLTQGYDNSKGAMAVALPLTNSCTGFASGAGTESEPYLISNRAQLEAISACVGDVSFKLTADIDLAGSNWTPIDHANGFRGTLDGAGFAIKNMTIVAASGVAGLFSTLAEGTIKRLRLEGVDITGASDLGAVAATAGAATVTDVMVTGLIDSTAEYRNVGGILGNTLKPGTFSRLSFRGVIKGYSTGGLFGAYQPGTGVAVSDVLVKAEFSDASPNWTQPNPVGRETNFALTRAAVQASRLETSPAQTFDFPALSGSSVVTNSVYVAAPGVPDLVSIPNLVEAVSADDFKDFSTYDAKGWSIADGYDASKVWGICERANDGFPFLTASYSVNPCVDAVVVNGPGSGQVASIPLASIQISLPSVTSETATENGAPAGITAGAAVEISGDGVETIVEVEVGQLEAPIIDLSNQTLTFEVPRSLTPGIYDLTLVSTEFGSITHQGLIKITAEQAFKLAWTKKVGKRVQIYSTMPEGFRFFVNGKEVKSRSGSKLVATVGLEPGKNVFSIRRDGKQVRRVVYRG